MRIQSYKNRGITISGASSILYCTYENRSGQCQQSDYLWQDQLIILKIFQTKIKREFGQKTLQNKLTVDQT